MQDTRKPNGEFFTAELASQARHQLDAPIMITTARFVVAEYTETEFYMRKQRSQRGTEKARPGDVFTTEGGPITRKLNLTGNQESKFTDN